MTTEEIIQRAQENAKQRLELIEEVQKLLQDEETWQKILKIDYEFPRKVIHYPGDITTHRIAKVLSKLK